MPTISIMLIEVACNNPISRFRGEEDKDIREYNVSCYLYSPMKYYIIAGEASGDLHGSNLIKELKKGDPATEVRCWGGDLMQQAGGVLVKHYKDLAFMGFVEVLANLRTIFKNIDFCKKDIFFSYRDIISKHSAMMVEHGKFR